MATSPSKEDPGPGVVPVYTPPPPVLNPSYQQGYQQVQYQPATPAPTAEVAEEAEAKPDDANSDAGYDTPGIPKEYLNVSPARGCW